MDYPKCEQCGLCCLSCPCLVNPTGKSVNDIFICDHLTYIGNDKFECDIYDQVRHKASLCTSKFKVMGWYDKTELLNSFRGVTNGRYL